MLSPCVLVKAQVGQRWGVKCQASVDRDVYCAARDLRSRAARQVQVSQSAAQRRSLPHHFLQQRYASPSLSWSLPVGSCYTCLPVYLFQQPIESTTSSRFCPRPSRYYSLSCSSSRQTFHRCFLLCSHKRLFNQPEIWTLRLSPFTTLCCHLATLLLLMVTNQFDRHDFFFLYLLLSLYNLYWRTKIFMYLLLPQSMLVTSL